MTLVYLGLGSNTDRDHYLCRGLDALAQLLGTLELSPVFESEAVGVLGHRFYNLVVRAETHLPLADLIAALKAIEAACGRRESRSPGRITLDIDVLTFGELEGPHAGVELPRPEVLTNAFVLWPLALLAPDLRLPGQSACIAALWNSWQGHQLLWPVAFDWQGSPLTSVSLIEAHQPRQVSGR